MVAKLQRLKRGFTLVELMIVVAIIGILAALAIYGVNRYVKSSKSAEAKEMLGRVAKNAVTAYETENMSGSVLALGGSASVNHRLCNTASPVPASKDKIKGSKYQSSDSDWSGSKTVGWKCLNFSITGPQYFQYDYVSTGPEGVFSAIARGDLDGDGSLSTFRLDGAVRTDTNGQKVATFAPNFVEIKPEE